MTNMNNNKWRNQTLLELINDNREKLERISSRIPNENLDEEFASIMKIHWEVETWLVSNVITMLERAIINQQLEDI